MNPEHLQTAIEAVTKTETLIAALGLLSVMGLYNSYRHYKQEEAENPVDFD